MQHDLFSAIQEGHCDRVREILLAHPELVNARNEAGVSAVLYAVHNGKNEVAKLLIDRGARLDIFEAAATGTQDRVEQLLQKDPAVLNAYSADGWTPLHLAVFFGRVNIVHLLLARGADINAVSNNEQKLAPLHSALANPNNAAVAQLLIDCRANLTVRQSSGLTPLHYAAANGLEAIVKNLIDRGVDRAVKDNSGKTARDLALEKGHAAVADLLKSS